MKFVIRSDSERVPASSICRFGAYCRVDSDCVLGNKCSIKNGYFSQCVADSTQFLPSSSGCLSDYDAPCSSQSVCCDPGSTCSSAEDGGVPVCRPIESSACLQPTGFDDP